MLLPPKTKQESDTSSRPYSPFNHRRTGSVPAGPRSARQTSRSIPTFGSTTYGYGSSAGSRPSSPSKSWLSQSQSYASSGPSRSFLTPPPRSSTAPQIPSLKATTHRVQLQRTRTHSLPPRLQLPTPTPPLKVLRSGGHKRLHAHL